MTPLSLYYRLKIYCMRPLDADKFFIAQIKQVDKAIGIRVFPSTISVMMSFLYILQNSGNSCLSKSGYYGFNDASLNIF